MMRIALILALATASLAQDVPVANCFHTTVAPIIDGRGDDAVWESAVRVDLVDVAKLDPTPHSQPTQARLLWGAEALYVLFEATDPDVWSSLSDRDDPLYNEEVVELFIDPDGDGLNYVEIEINSVGTIFDLLVTKSLRQGGKGMPVWDPALETGVSTQGTINDPSDTDSGWSAEIALPWSALQTSILDVPGSMALPPNVGDRWRLNLYRYERLRTAGVATGTIEYSAWSPVGRIDFHAPDRFGIVVFADERTAVNPMSWGRVKISD
ncbi:MAG: carbohydrate-binding family 9-like protein [Gemmatimonadetes bacterium]|jgi:hypothetical protein|nr:carbohydrate-binding family 9-like protein [Gemmatimonadota bacterium]MBT6147399.1 carbohydrate-binding family 9-like protein [Gemmatimonadota bacterium]MBT7864628.1 carbohydrate-binding family 9-like protein [Gemmatimonadota bacterium]